MSGELSRRDAILTAGAALVGASTANAAPGSALGSVPDLAGKIVVVETRQRSHYNPLILGGCRFELQAGRMFLAGVLQPESATKTSFTDGIPCCVAWDLVEQYLIYSSLAEYHERLERDKVSFADEIPF